MGVRDEKRRDDVVFFRGHAGQTLTAAPLRAEVGKWCALDVAARSNGDDHVLALDEVLVLHVAGPFDDLGATGDGKELLHLAKLIRDDSHDPLARAKDV